MTCEQKAEQIRQWKGFSPTPRTLAQVFSGEGQAEQDTRVKQLLNEGQMTYEQKAEQIRQWLTKPKNTQRAICKALGCSEFTLSRALNYEQPSALLTRAIDTVLD